MTPEQVAELTAKNALPVALADLARAQAQVLELRAALELTVDWQFRKGLGGGAWTGWMSCGCDEYARLTRMPWAYETRQLCVRPAELP